MSSFLGKLRAVTLGAAHDLLDREIDMNSPSMLRQFVRDLEAAIGKMNSELAVQLGQLRTLKREQGDLQHEIDGRMIKLRAMADAQGNAARSLAALIVQDKQHLDQMTTDIANQQKMADDLGLAVGNLQSKHDLMVSRVRELERIDRDSKAKESAAKALNQAGSILGSVGSTSIDDLEDRMQRRNDVAGAKFDQAMGSMAGAGAQPDTHSAEVDELLASLKD